jgi:hypothetical protein
VLDRRAVLGIGQLEDALHPPPGLQFPNWDGATNFVVVVAEVLLAEARTAATAAIGQDVAALIEGLFVRLGAVVGL